jgi:hypothetical protein
MISTSFDPFIYNHSTSPVYLHLESGGPYVANALEARMRLPGLWAVIASLSAISRLLKNRALDAR